MVLRSHIPPTSMRRRRPRTLLVVGPPALVFSSNNAVQFGTLQGLLAMPTLRSHSVLSVFAKSLFGADLRSGGRPNPLAHRPSLEQLEVRDVMTGTLFSPATQVN